MCALIASENLHKGASSNIQTLSTLFNEALQSFGSQDVRTDYFSSFYQLSVWLKLQFQFFPQVDTNAKKLTITDSNMRQFLSQYKTITMASFITRVHFDIEIFLSILAKHVMDFKSHGFYKIIKHIEDWSKEKGLNISRFTLDALRCISAWRNSLHNNGYYNDPKVKELIVSIRGQTYSFHEGGQIEVSWGKIFKVIDEWLEVLNSLLKSPSIMNIKQISRL